MRKHAQNMRKHAQNMRKRAQNMRKHAQNMRKICAKYAQNMRNPKKWGRFGHPISHHPGTFITKYDDIFDQKKVLFTLSTLKVPYYFFSKNLGLLRDPKFFGSPKIFIRSPLFW
jgi:hypothetical protein